MKRCNTCGVEKPIDRFHHDHRKKGRRHAKCKACTQVVRNKWRAKNKDKVASYFSNWRINNMDKELERSRRFREKNRSVSNAYASKRRAMLLDQTPDMNKAELVEIEAMYLYNHIMPGDWEVDHIVALANGGLHHPSNLQVLTAHDNRSKGARA